MAGGGSGGMVGNVGTGRNNTGVSGPTVGMEMNPYQQIAPLTNQQLAGMQLTSDVAGPAQQALANAQGANQAMMAGSGFNPNTQNFMTSGALMNANANPYIQGQYDAASQALRSQYEQATAPNLLQQAASSGTLGSQGMAQGFQDAQSTLGANLGDLASNMYGNAYNQGLQGTLQAQQMGLGGLQNAISQAPGLASAQFGPAQQLMGTGGTAQQQMQNVLNAANQNLTGQAQWPLQALQMLGQGLNTASGGGGQSFSVGSMPGGGGK